jgi:hypothetical protein
MDVISIIPGGNCQFEVVGEKNIRFLTIGTCFFAETICDNVSMSANLLISLRHQSYLVVGFVDKLAIEVEICSRLLDKTSMCGRYFQQANHSRALPEA